MRRSQTMACGDCINFSPLRKAIQAAGLALFLSSLGIYGVMSFIVAQSTSEIGLRIALGATESEVVRSVLNQGLEMASVGLALGFVGAYVAGRVMQRSPYGTGALDWGG